MSPTILCKALITELSNTRSSLESAAPEPGSPVAFLLSSGFSWDSHYGLFRRVPRKARKCCPLPGPPPLCFQQLNPLFRHPDCGGVLWPIGRLENAHFRMNCPTPKRNDDPRGIVESGTSLASLNSHLGRGGERRLGLPCPRASASLSSARVAPSSIARAHESRRMTPRQQTRQAGDQHQDLCQRRLLAPAGKSARISSRQCPPFRFHPARSHLGP